MNGWIPPRVGVPGFVVLVTAAIVSILGTVGLLCVGAVCFAVTTSTGGHGSGHAFDMLVLAVLVLGATYSAAYGFSAALVKGATS